MNFKDCFTACDSLFPFFLDRKIVRRIMSRKYLRFGVQNLIIDSLFNVAFLNLIRNNVRI